MKIGYPCINLTVGCVSSKTFRLGSYSENRLIDAVENNLNCLQKILSFNVEKEMLFFRISSEIVPFASHPVCKFKWEKRFKEVFHNIGSFIKVNNIRISMHPDQFTLINSIDEMVYNRSIEELKYHVKILDLLGLDTSAKVQIHVGGVYNDKRESIKRFVRRYKRLSKRIKRRLVIENDDRLYNLEDCLSIHEEAGIPILFDVFHHAIYNSGESVPEALERFSKTWEKNDGIPMIDYSSQQVGERRGNHAKTIDIDDFKKFLIQTKGFDFDVMLEIKDKENSALKAVEAALADRRFGSGSKC